MKPTKKMISLKLSDADRALLKAAADRRSMTQTQFVEQAIRKYASLEIPTWEPEVPAQQQPMRWEQQPTLDLEAA